MSSNKKPKKETTPESGAESVLREGLPIDDEPIVIDTSDYDRTTDLEMTDPARKTIKYTYTGKVQMTGTFEKLTDRLAEEQKNAKPLEMTSVPVSELGQVGTDTGEDDDQPYSPDSADKPKKSGRPTHIVTDGYGNVIENTPVQTDKEHHHHHRHHHSSEHSDEHHHHHHHHSSERSDEHHHHHSHSTGKAAAATVAKTEKSTDGTEKKKKSKKTEAKPLKPLFRIANIVYPAAVFALTAVMFMVLPRPESSETEQRSLAKFPEFSFDSFLNGEYTNGITEYFNDAIPYRDDLKKAAAQVRGMFGISDGDKVDEISGPIAVITEEEEPEPPVVITTTTVSETAPATDKAPEKSETTPAVTAAAPETTAPETTETPAETTKNVNEIAEGVITNGQVVTKLSDGHWWAMSLFGGGKGTVYAAALNVFKEQLGDKVNVYSMVVPTAGEYYLPDTYASYSASHQKSIDSIDSMLNGVTSVPAITALWNHTDEPIYTRTDHHWQPLGAYYAAQCFAETAGVPFADISTMQQVDVPGYMGTMYSFTESANLLSDPETFTYYKPTNAYTTYYYDRAYNYQYNLPFFVPMPTNGSYSTFMGGDDKIVRITTDAGTGRKLVVFKDSYGNAEIPFYFGSFDEIWVCDMRYFDLNAVEFVEFTGATDLLFTMCTFSAVGSNANHLNVILNNPVTGITEPLAQ